MGALLHATKVSDVVVVIPPGRAADFSWLKSVRVHLVENPRPEQGMISSIRTALRTTWVAGHDFLICPGDVPFVSPQIVNRIIGTFMARECRIVIPTYKGMGGHPGLFAASLTDDFLLRGDAERHPGDPRPAQGGDGPAQRPRPRRLLRRGHPRGPASIAEDPGARWARVERDLEERQRLRLR